MAEGVIDLASILMGGVTGESSGTVGYSEIEFPLSIPSVSGIREIIIGRDEIRGVSESPFSLHRKTFRHQGERWRWSVGLPRMTREHADEWTSLLMMLDGGFGTFLFGDVFNDNPRGLAWGTPRVHGSGQTGKVLITNGWNPNVTNVLKAGDKIQIGTSLYQTLRDTNSDGTGSATLDIFPRLRESFSDDTPIITNRPRGLFQLANPGGQMQRRSLGGVDELYSFEIIEAF